MTEIENGWNVLISEGEIPIMTKSTHNYVVGKSMEDTYCHHGSKARLTI